MRHWPFILAAYGLAAAVLIGYWRRVERGIQALESELGDKKRP